jgi:hypothetical protein
MRTTGDNEMDYYINPEAAVLDILERTLQVTEHYLHVIYPELKNPERSGTSSCYQAQISCASHMIDTMQALQKAIGVYRHSLLNFIDSDPPDFMDGDWAGDSSDIPL